MVDGSISGWRGLEPSAWRSPRRTYATDSPSMLACILSGLSTIVLSEAFEVRGLEYRWP